MELKPDYSID